MSFNSNIPSVKVELDNAEQSRKDLREGIKADLMAEKLSQTVGVFFPYF